MTNTGSIKKYIWVQFQKEGIHSYPAALEDMSLQSVRFLGFEHRHTFHFKVKLEVEHSDRAVEFIMFKRWLEALYEHGTLQLDHLSCEMMAEELLNILVNKYPNRYISVDVSEDAENGGVVEYIPT